MKNNPDLPPILPDIENLLKEYIICPDRLPIHNYEQNQEFWPREPDVSELFDLDRTISGTTLKVQRDLNTGKILEFREVPVENNDNFASSLLKSDLEKNLSILLSDIDIPVTDTTEITPVDSSELLTVPPGFENGIKFQDDGYSVLFEESHTESKSNQTQKIEDSEDIVNLMELVKKEQDFLEIWNEKTLDNTPQSEDKQLINQSLNFEIDENEIIPNDERIIPVLNITANDLSNKATPVTKEWAVLLDTNPQSVRDFHERIPTLAQEYPFELDVFQKQAILKLEENCDVFVAAHTSAGKTVVAEYAIALSQSHKTRTIYTSPIKALSNQKFNDFKKKFEDVGLVTGDYQINSTGACLIMTTEILRSILYARRGKDIIRDLEYVVFDEVHYINDPDRGYVWEEVLILLPDYVRIVLLSATVPNTMEFANWLGMTKHRIVYVVSTLHRPVPLQHYLYTGCSTATKDERFLLIDQKGNFLLKGHSDAIAKLSSRKSIANFRFVPEEIQRKQEATALTGLIYHLKSKELLPVIMFTFSRVQCDNLSQSLKTIDLTTQKEKNTICLLFEKYIKILKEPDRKIPQIIKIQSILQNGIAVHHSGILPIVKEIVELLFQKGLVKVLFATETFAMGVNMPARTVVFNQIKKYDGQEVRELKPAEYIQMAGRAGRRGMDATGTVIVRCKESVPDTHILKNMMLGQPEKLVSQFRLTYSMILSVLPRGGLSVESMMSHSFHEVGHELNAKILKIELKKAQIEFEAEAKKDLGEHRQQLVKFFEAASDYMQQWCITQPKLIIQPRVVKEMIPGRVLVIDHKNHFNKLGILLSTKKVGQMNNFCYTYKVLVLADQTKPSETIEIPLKNAEKDSKKPEESLEWYKCLSYTYDDIFQPQGVGGHEVLELPAVDITRITSKVIKIDCNLVLQDWDKRQIPRFKDNAPGQTCQQAIQELTKLTVMTDENLSYLNHKDFRINDIELCKSIEYLNQKQIELQSLIHCTKIANFEEEFLAVFKRKTLEFQVEKLKFLISNRSLSLYSEYESRIEVLKMLKYINQHNIVELKGKVACEIGMNELLVTELVLRNQLTHLPAAEVAALLSCIVYQGKITITEPLKDRKITETLRNAIDEMQNIHKELRDVERQNCVNSSDDELNFDLVEVVYDWAQKKEFAEIMKLTEIQEGIIVRCIQQLNETIKDVWKAAIKIGDTVLQSKMEEASQTIKRDIVFAASLYTTQENIMNLDSK